jgi:hypothetical protein
LTVGEAQAHTELSLGSGRLLQHDFPRFPELASAIPLMPDRKSRRSDMATDPIMDQKRKNRDAIRQLFAPVSRNTASEEKKRAFRTIGYQRLK